MSFLLNFLFPPPPSVYLTAMSVISFTSLSYSGFSEVRGTHVQYSKFWNTAQKKNASTVMKLSSRTGMLLLYTPAFLAGLASLGLSFVDQRPRSILLCSALTVHFLKRVLEVLFVHKYSGGMDLDSAIVISLSYFLATVNAIYAQHMTLGMPDPPLDLEYAGVVLFLVGIAGNYYHHLLLQKLRGRDDKGYKIPKGGLFGLVICPHYLFEIMGFVGISFIAQTVFAFAFTLGTVGYLTGRSYATRKWYLSKFPNFPREVKALFPFVF
ncbi:steroid 5-alpha-reductase DET2-like isoform X2 [Magnolia sinica]|uniref:steroid 5-alpha-reductase DET2-like isoform X2 n=1 Tax=Magnolia sinica TaxID=86752 RepID=UPI0026592882|nr:steroid 5-alpha-reductase DET2-like isoform X2 [Magnolia sinica]